MNAEQDLDRNEAATPHKLSEARKRGQVAKSVELASALVLTVAAVLLCARGWDALLEQFKIGQRLLSLAGTAAQQGGSPWYLWDVAAGALRAALVALVPIWAVVMIAAALAHVMQTGVIWSWHPLKPDWQRLNPAAGIKRVFALRTLFDGGKAVVKLVVFGLLIGWALQAAWPQFSHMTALTAPAFAHYALDGLCDFAVKTGAALCLIALIDAIYSHRDFARRMRMSRRDVRDETKHREGDPRIRSRLRALRREMLKRSAALRRTAGADVVITNPTHIAVALRYRHGQMEAPVLVSKGAGGYALAIRVIAAKHRVPVVCSPTLARALHKRTDIDSPIPADLYAGVARLMVWLLAMNAMPVQRAGAAT